MLGASPIIRQRYVCGTFLGRMQCIYVLLWHNTHYERREGQGRTMASVPSSSAFSCFKGLVGVLFSMLWNFIGTKSWVTTWGCFQAGLKLRIVVREGIKEDFLFFTPLPKTFLFSPFRTSCPLDCEIAFARTIIRRGSDDLTENGFSNPTLSPPVSPST